MWKLLVVILSLPQFVGASPSEQDKVVSAYLGWENGSKMSLQKAPVILRSDLVGFSEAEFSTVPPPLWMGPNPRGSSRTVMIVQARSEVLQRIRANRRKGARLYFRHKGEWIGFATLDAPLVEPVFMVNLDKKFANHAKKLAKDLNRLVE